jgi:hypothetical protein
MHMRGTRIEKWVEICATNLANKIQCMSTIFVHFFALVLMHLVAQISNSFSILDPRMCMHYQSFCCVFSCYLPPN